MQTILRFQERTDDKSSLGLDGAYDNRVPLHVSLRHDRIFASRQYHFHCGNGILDLVLPGIKEAGKRTEAFLQTQNPLNKGGCVEGGNQHLGG